METIVTAGYYSTLSSFTSFLAETFLNSGVSHLGYFLGQVMILKISSKISYFSVWIPQARCVLATGFSPQLLLLMSLPTLLISQAFIFPIFFFFSGEILLSSIYFMTHIFQPSYFSAHFHLLLRPAHLPGVCGQDAAGSRRQSSGSLPQQAAPEPVQ